MHEDVPVGYVADAAEEFVERDVRSPLEVPGCVLPVEARVEHGRAVDIGEFGERDDVVGAAVGIGGPAVDSSATCACGSVNPYPGELSLCLADLVFAVG